MSAPENKKCGCRAQRVCEHWPAIDSEGYCISDHNGKRWGMPIFPELKGVHIEQHEYEYRLKPSLCDARFEKRMAHYYAHEKMFAAPPIITSKDIEIRHEEMRNASR